MDIGNIQKAVAELSNGRPANIVYPPRLRYGIRNVVESWKKFCTLPAERKQEFVYVDHPVFDGSGYELKGEKGTTHDRKENFHMTLRDSSRLVNDAFDLGINGGSEFIYEAAELIESARLGVGEFMGYLGKALSLPTLKEEVMGVKDRWVFRYLHYFGENNIGDQIAAPHADKSGITLHLFESAPGLEYLDFQKQWQPMPVHDGGMAIIPGMQLQFASRNTVKALCHRVIATEESYVFGRYSVVCFIPIPGAKVVNKNGVGRLQDFAPGFNYDMALPEFQTLFA